MLGSLYEGEAASSTLAALFFFYKAYFTRLGIVLCLYALDTGYGGQACAVVLQAGNNVQRCHFELICGEDTCFGESWTSSKVDLSYYGIN